MSSDRKFAQIKKWAEEAKSNWLEKNVTSKECVTTHVRGILNEKIEEIILTAMGFSRAFGEWEIRDRKESQVEKFIRENAQTTSQLWLSEQMGKLPNIPKQAMRALKAEYQEMIQDKLRELLMEHATGQAQKEYDQIVGEESEGDGHDEDDGAEDE
jgi:hypothetical protein